MRITIWACEKNLEVIFQVQLVSRTRTTGGNCLPNLVGVRSKNRDKVQQCRMKRILLVSTRWATDDSSQFERKNQLDIDFRSTLDQLFTVTELYRRMNVQSWLLESINSCPAGMWINLRASWERVLLLGESLLYVSGHQAQHVGLVHWFMIVHIVNILRDG